MKALVGAFNQEKALVGAFSVIVQPVVKPMDRFTALVRSILDYEIEIYPLDAEEKQYSALNMNYSVAGFKLVLARKMSFYVVTYYLPSGLFVVVSWISFLVNPEVRSHRRFCQENSPQMCGWQS